MEARIRWFACLCLLVMAGWPVTKAQSTDGRLFAGPNVNMVSGTITLEACPSCPNGYRVVNWGGDSFLQRQNEPSMGSSWRNEQHLIASSNDYRTVDFPGDPSTGFTRDSWLGLFKSFDGGDTWQSTVFPGYWNDPNNPDPNSPILGFEAAADPTVRCTAFGLCYASGIAFNHTSNDLGAVFVSTFIDLNDYEGARFKINSDEDPIKYIRTSVVESGTSGQFMDKPWLAVDVPRPQLKSYTTTDVQKTGAPGVVGGDWGDPTAQSLPCGNAYLAWANFVGETKNNVRSKLEIVNSTDCGKTWSSPPKVIDQSYKISQGVSIAIDPATGIVYVAWRQFGVPGDPEAFVIARSTDATGTRFTKAYPIVTFDPADPDPKFPFGLDTRPAFQDDPFRQFRSEAFPSIAVDETGQIYATWSEQGHWGQDLDGDGVRDGSRVVLQTGKWTDLKSGPVWTFQDPVVVDDTSRIVDRPGTGPTVIRGHQAMPSLSYVDGKLMLLYYDLVEDDYTDRFDAVMKTPYGPDGTTNQEICVASCQSDPQYDAASCPSLCDFEPEGAVADPMAFDPIPVFHTSDVHALWINTASLKNWTGSPQGDSTKVTDYLTGIVTTPDGQSEALQLEFDWNPPIFAGGTAPFRGDYIDTVSSPSHVPVRNADGSVSWSVNRSGDSLNFHGVWTDNRDVLPPPIKQDADGAPLPLDWTHYSPPCQEGQDCVCDPDNFWTKNQNIYTSLISQGLVLGSYGNSRPFLVDGAPIRRAFSLFVKNTVQEDLPTDSSGNYDLSQWNRRTKYVRVTLQPDPAVRAWFPVPREGEPAQVCGSDSAGRPTCLLLELPSVSSAAVTVFAELASVSTSKAMAPVKVLAQESDVDGTLLPGGLKASLMLNPDPTNPAPRNIDQGGDAQLKTAETREPEFVPFVCDDEFPAGTDPDIVHCPAGKTVFTLITTWPALDNGSGSLSSRLLDPGLLSPALLNPAVLPPQFLNPRMALSMINPRMAPRMATQLLNPRMAPRMATTLLNPRMATSILNPRMAPRMASSVLNPRMAVAALNPRMATPVLNPRMATPLSEADETAPWEQGKAESFVLDATFSTRLLSDTFRAGTSFTDYTWRVTNVGDASSGYLVKILSSLSDPNFKLPQDSQLIVYRTYPTLTTNACYALEEATGYEILANLLLDDPDKLTPEFLNATFALAPTPFCDGANCQCDPATDPTCSAYEPDVVYVTLRAPGPAGTFAVDPSLLTTRVEALDGSASPPFVQTLVIIPPSPVPGAAVGSPYHLALSLAGGSQVDVPSYDWSLDSGSLPPGLSLSPSTGTISGIPQVTGEFTAAVTVLETGAGIKNPQSASLNLTIHVDRATLGTGSLTLSSDPPSPSSFGDPVTFMATILPPAGVATVPGGSVTFRDEAGALGEAQLLDAQGKAVLETNTLSVGTHSISFDYSGDANFGPSSTTDGLSFTVNPLALTDEQADLSADPTTPDFSTPVSFTLILTGPAGVAAPSGSVLLWEGTPPSGADSCDPSLGCLGVFSFQGTAATSTGTQSTFTVLLQPGQLSGGGHPITALYLGDTNFTPTTFTLDNPPGTITIEPASLNLQGISLGASPNPAIFGDVVTLTLTLSDYVQGHPPAGTIAFSENGNPIACDTGSCSLVEGTDGRVTASVSTGALLSLSGAPHDVVASFAGDTNYGAFSTHSSVVVNRRAAQVLLDSSPAGGTLSPDQPVAYRASVVGNPSSLTYPAPAVGTVQFWLVSPSETMLGEAPLVGGVASWTGSAFPLGSFSIEARYSGDANYLAGTSSPPLEFSCTFGFTGFLSPLTTAVPGDGGTPDAPEQYSASRNSLPIKWQLFGADGTPVSDLSVVRELFVIRQSDGVKIPLIAPDQAPGSTDLRYVSDGWYIFNWDTTSVSSGVYTIVLRLSDGSAWSLTVALT